MRAPPPRYKVVERGRRLEVIDTRTGKPAAPIAKPLAPPARPGPAGVDDGTVFTTRSWYDDKAPRTIRMNFATKAKLDNLRVGVAVAVALFVAASVLFWPFVPIIAAGLAAQPKLRKQLRSTVTKWIDRLDQAG